MGLFDGLFGGGDDTQTTVQSTNIPAWLSRGGEENYNVAKNITSQPYTPYTGPRVAPFGADTLKAFDLTRSNVGAATGDIGKARGALDAASAGLPGIDLSAYMNPFTQNVIDTTLAQVQRQSDIARRANNQRATAAGAFGDSRHGVIESEQQAASSRLMSEIIASLMSQNFLQGQAAATSDLNRRFAAAPQYVATGQAAQRAGLTDASAMAAVGEAEQGQVQKNLDTAYADFLRQIGWPFEMLNYRTGTLAGTPYKGEVVTTGPAQTADPFAQLLGLAATGAGIYGLTK